MDNKLAISGSPLKLLQCLCIHARFDLRIPIGRTSPSTPISIIPETNKPNPMHEQKNSLPPCTDQLQGYRVFGGHEEMDLPPQIDDYIKDTIDHTLGLSVLMQM